MGCAPSCALLPTSSSSSSSVSSSLSVVPPNPKFAHVKLEEVVCTRGEGDARSLEGAARGLLWPRGVVCETMLDNMCAQWQFKMEVQGVGEPTPHMAWVRLRSWCGCGVFGVV